MDIFEKALSETGNATCTEITESDIAAVEASIKIGFPLGYRDFLKTKNGFTGWLGANFVSFYALSEIADENYPDWTEFFPNTVRIGDTKALEITISRHHASVYYRTLATSPILSILEIIGPDSYVDWLTTQFGIRI